MVIVGLILTINISSTIPVGQSGMTDEEKLDLMLAEQENEDYNTLAGILFGLGFIFLIENWDRYRNHWHYNILSVIAEIHIWPF